MNQNDAIEVFSELAPNCNDIQEHFGTYSQTGSTIEDGFIDCTQEFQKGLQTFKR